MFVPFSPKDKDKAVNPCAGVMYLDIGEKLKPANVKLKVSFGVMLACELLVIV